MKEDGSQELCFVAATPFAISHEQWEYSEHEKYYWNVETYHQNDVVVDEDEGDHGKSRDPTMMMRYRRLLRRGGGHRC